MLAPSIFDKINAKALSPVEVAKTFVPSEHFDQAVQNRNSIIVGPRGSGKTTLLKMLQSAALCNWGHERASYYREQVEYSGVFISADVMWNEQTKFLGNGKLTPRFHSALTSSAFTTHVLRSFVSAIITHVAECPGEYCVPYFHVDIDRRSEGVLVSNLAEAWYICLKVQSLSALKKALTRRLQFIGELSSRASVGGEDEEKRILSEFPFLNIEFLSALPFIADAFEEISDLTGRKWAMLFDEMELVPSDIFETLLQASRSFDSRFLFKMSMCPFSETANKFIRKATGPMAGHDFDLISLAYVDKRDTQEFSKNLFNSILKEMGVSDLTAEKVLGYSITDSIPNSEKAGYIAGSDHYKSFKQLSKKDKTFRKYLANKKINIEDMQHGSESQRATNIRKIMPIVVFRNALLTTSDPPKLRSRKSPKLYHGASSLFAICEGNPRWFLGIIKPLLKNIPDNNNFEVSPTEQNSSVTRAGNRFCSLLKSIPTNDQNTLSVLEVLKKIGDFFFKQAISGQFSPEPPASFIIDDKCSESFVRSLGNALNAGAIVCADREEAQSCYTSVRGKRYRLSHLYASTHRLPLRLGSSRNLSRILMDPSLPEDWMPLFQGDSDENSRDSSKS